MKVIRQVALTDALHNLASDSGATNDYCQGLVVGIVSALMATGFDFKDAIAQVAISFPDARYSPRYAVPDSWKNDLGSALLSVGKKI